MKNKKTGGIGQMGECYRKKTTIIVVAAGLVFSCLAFAFAALTPDAAERVIERTARGRFVFVAGYMDAVEATTATATQKWMSAKKMVGLFAEHRDIRRIVAELNATEKALARTVLVNMKDAVFAAERAALTALEDEITTGMME
jgi:hypothetical protein